MNRLLLTLLAACTALLPLGAAAGSRELVRDARRALDRLKDKNPGAEAIAEKSVAVLVFPTVVKAGFMVGAQTGNGVLFKDGRVAGFYNTTAASYGLQAGVQKFSYALFFMSDKALSYLNKSDGFELGVGPSIVVVDEGLASSLSTTTLQKGIYAFIFGQQGLMAGLGLQGTKITRYEPSDR